MKNTQLFTYKKLIVNSLCILITTFCLSNCTSTELEPAYIHIDTVKVAATFQEGSGSNNIKNVWVFVDNEPLGAFQLPAQIPTLTLGESNIEVFAGIANNGILSTRLIYPFYTSDKFTRTLVPFETVTLQPTVQYKNNINFVFINNFEINNNFDDDNPEANQLQTTGNPDLVFEGSKSGVIRLTGGNTSFKIATIDAYALPGINRPTFLEVDYKCSFPFQVLVGAFKASEDGIQDPVLVITAKEDWNKIYIDLTSIVTQRVANGFDRFKIYFSSSLPDSISQASFYWDNIKLLYEP